MLQVNDLDALDFIGSEGQVVALAVVNREFPMTDHFLTEFQAAAEVCQEEVLFFWVDLWENPRIGGPDHLAIVGLPTIFLYKNGRPLLRMVGLQDREGITRRLKSAMVKSRGGGTKD